MAREQRAESGGYLSRRRVLKTVAAGSVVGMGSLAGCDGDGDGGTPTPTESDTATFLLSTAQSGQYGSIGDNERRGFELAIRHINEGRGYVEAGVFEGLSAGGVLGKTVQGQVLDSGGSRETARSNLLPYAENDTAAMVCGGVSGRVVRGNRSVATEFDLPYMAGVSLLEEFAGEQCASTVYRECYTSRALMKALGPVLAEAVPDATVYHQFYTDAPEGRDLESAVNGYFNRSRNANWQPRGSTAVTPGSTNFGDEMNAVAASQPEVVVLSLFGLDAVNALVAARDNLPEDTRIVIPFIDDSLGHALDTQLAGVYGTIPWDAEVESSLGETFETSYVTWYGRSAGGQARTGSGTAHVTYTQTLQFAAAAERAGSFEADAIRSELEGTSYDVGLGSQTMQACNHQATRPVPVVRGLESRMQGNKFELLSLATDVTAGCEATPASNCTL